MALPHTWSPPPIFQYFYHGLLAAMHSGVTFRAQRDQIFLCIGSRMAAEFPVVHLKIRHRAT